MPAWPDPRSLSVGFALGSNQYDDPTGLTYTIVSPGDDPDTGDDPGPVLDTVVVERGRTGDAPETAPTRVALALRNDNGVFSRRNVLSPYYGQLRPGMWFRVYVDLGSGPQVLVSACAESFNPIRSGPNLDPIVLVTGLGLLDRVSRDTTIRSRMRRYWSRRSELRRYWPMEDLADQFASGLPTGEAFVVADVDYASASDLLGSLPLPVFGVASDLTVPLSAPDLDGSWCWSFYVKYPAAPGSLTTLLTMDLSGGTIARVEVTADTTDVVITVYDDGGSAVASGTSLSDLYDTLFSGGWVRVDVFGSTGSTAVFFMVRTVGDTVTPTVTAFHASVDVGTPITGRVPASAVLDGASFGHMFLSDLPVGIIADRETGGAGEQADDRISRFATDDEIPFESWPGGPWDTEQLGASRPNTTYRTWRDAEDTDGGVIFELRDGQVTYQPRTARYNLDPAMTLDFGEEDGTGDVADVVPLDDSRDTYNVITATAPDGSFAVAEQTTGPVGSDTSTGIGPRPLSVQRNVYNPARLVDHANWTRTIKTVNQQRQTAALNLYTNPNLAASWLGSDIGSRFQVTGPPLEDFGPDDLDLILEGSKDVIGAARWDVTAFGEPYAPYDVAVAADSGSPAATDSRADTPGCTLAEDLDTTETGVDVTNTDADFDWSATAVPYDIAVGGERMTVTAVSGSGASQTLTVTRSVNGVVKSHSTGAAVALFRTPIVAL